MQTLEKSFKALADETRIRCVGLLWELGELCVCEIECALQITQSKASRHLRYLVAAGLLESRREGVWMHYRLSRELTPEQRALLDVVRGHLSQPPFPELFARVRRSLSLKRECAPGVDSPPQKRTSTHGTPKSSRRTR